MINTILTIKKKKELLQTLFGFDLINVGLQDNYEHYVIYDAEGDEFYGSDYNCQFNFDTLADFFMYAEKIALDQGYFNCQFKMREVLGLK